jgi:hypothetical protein
VPVVPYAGPGRLGPRKPSKALGSTRKHSKALPKAREASRARACPNSRGDSTPKLKVPLALFPQVAGRNTGSSPAAAATRSTRPGARSPNTRGASAVSSGSSPASSAGVGLSTSTTSRSTSIGSTSSEPRIPGRMTSFSSSPLSPLICIDVRGLELDGYEAAKDSTFLFNAFITNWSFYYEFKCFSQKLSFSISIGRKALLHLSKMCALFSP